ncbi:hypothetical protein N5918_11075 [Glaesserella parasuis]|nr:hypothetical protein [Glaesserella parasuis]MDP0273909.1 hypothetical protein [Glaesserella parasuis]MDP0307883.1 hypothetical protein [Glaesserella parasuis]MDP0472673.1 hypothetical protein [Glaesserella parasuis]
MLIRVGGAARSVGGVAATVFGVGICETGMGCIGGVPIAAYGVDNAVAGAKTIYSGKYHSTIGAAALADLTGINPETAELIYSSPSMVFGAKPIAMGAAKATGEVANEVARVGGDVKYVAGELGKDVRGISGYLNEKATKFGVNVHNSQALTNINNTIPKEYKAALGIEVTTGAMVESLYYLDGSKEVNLPNLLNSGFKVGIDSAYGAAVHKLNPVYGVVADTAKGVMIDDKNITDSAADAAQSGAISSFSTGVSGSLKLGEATDKAISSLGIKTLEYIQNLNKSAQGSKESQ